MTTGTAMAADTAAGDVTVEREEEYGGSRLSLIDCLASCTSETPSAASSQAGKVCLTKGHLHLRHRETIPPASSLASHTHSLARSPSQSVIHSINIVEASERASGKPEAGRAMGMAPLAEIDAKPQFLGEDTKGHSLGFCCELFGHLIHSFHLGFIVTLRGTK